MVNIEELSEHITIKEEQWFAEKIALKEQVDRFREQSSDNQYLL